jgi:hypothetical protein
MKVPKAFFELREVFPGEETWWAPALHDPSPQFERQELLLTFPRQSQAEQIG